MPNANSVVSAISSAGKFCPSAAQGASSTSEFQFQDSSSNALVCWLPGSSKVANRPIRIKAWGRVTGGTTTNFTAQIYMANATTSQTLANSTSLATTGAIAVNSLSGNFELELTGIWDSTSNKFQGVQAGWVNGTAVARAIASSVTKPALAPSTEGIGITASGTFSASNASNAAILDGLEVEVL